MQAQIVLTPTESKKLISHAVLQLPIVQNALKEGILVLHPSSSTYFMYEELVGKPPEGLWVCGVIAPSGLTGSREASEMILARGPGAHDPRKVSRQAWFLHQGVLQDAAALGDILNQMGENDVYIKGVNAVDAQGNVGVLFANPAGGGGTIGRVLTAQRQKNFHILFPVGYEKLIPGSMKEVCHYVNRKAELSMGLPCGVFPVDGQKIDEIDAIDILFGTKAQIISAGGLGGAEGSVVIAIDGEEENVQKAFQYAQTLKDAKLPVLKVSEINKWPSE